MKDKYLIIMCFVLIGYLFYKQNIQENFSESDSDITQQIKDTIRTVYNADVESIRNLSEVATKLQEGTLTVAGDLTIKGKLKVEDSILLGNMDTNQWTFNSPNDDSGKLLINRVKRDGIINLLNGLNLTTNSDGSEDIGTNNLMPSGTIVAWNGTIDTIPNGWLLCDGLNSTPNLSGRFIYGLNKDNGNYNTNGKTGGAETVQLSVAQLPAHAHSYIDWKPSGTTPVQGKSGGQNVTINNVPFAPNSTGSTGSNQSHENMPPYYVLAYIMRL